TAVTCRVSARRRFERPLPNSFPIKRTDWNRPNHAIDRMAAFQIAGSGADRRKTTLCRSSAQSSRWGDDLGADVLGSFGISPIAGPDFVGLLVRIRFHLFLPQRNANRAGSGSTRGCGEVATVSARPDIQLTRMEHLAVCDLSGERSIHVARRRAPGRAAGPVISATFRRRPAHLPTA